MAPKKFELDSNPASFSQNYQNIQKFNQENLKILQKFNNKFSYDSVITYLYSIALLLVAFGINLIAQSFGFRIALIGDWEAFLSYRKLWQILDNSSEEVSKLVFSLIRTVKDNLLMLVIAISSFVYVSLAYMKVEDVDENLFEKLTDLVTDYKFLRNLAFFLLNFYIFVKVLRSLSSQLFKSNQVKTFLASFLSVLRQSENLSIMVLFLGIFAIKNDNYVL